jgi:hypothetical protein
MKMQKKTPAQINAMTPSILMPVFVKDFISCLSEFLGFLRRGADGDHICGAQTAFRF